MSLTETSLPLTVGTWQADTAHSSIEFTVRHLGISKVRGRFNDFSATLTVGDSLATSKVDASVELSSVDTNNADRDAHLQGTDFFNTESNPQMVFAGRSIKQLGNDYELEGELSINGTSIPVSFEVEFHGLETFPMDQSTRSGFNATAAISRKAFGVEFDVPLGADKVMISDKVSIDIDVQFVQPSS